jgi:membrane fusion protein, type I secretion system
MSGTIKTATHSSIRHNIGVGIGVIVLLLGGVVAWGSTTNISGAIIAAGRIVVDSNIKKVQHPTGGTVAELRVREDQRVKKGDVLVHLDDTVTRANLGVVTNALDELQARKARLESERDGLDHIAFPDDLERRAKEDAVARLMQGERKLFESRRAARAGERAQLRQRIEQLNKELVGYQAQERAKSKEITLIASELESAKKLWDKNLIPLTKYISLQRDAARLEGEHGVLIATQSQIRGKIAEIELQIIQIDRDMTSEVGRELRDVDAKLGELVQRKIAAEDQLKRVNIRAPQDGIVYQLGVHSADEVINPGDTIMLIVPEKDQLKVEAKIAPQDIDQIAIGEAANLRFSAFDQRTTPEINGTVARISPDTSTDPRTGQSFYTARIDVTPSEIARLGAVKLVPGMPVEVFIKTGEHNALSYLLKPLDDQIERAFRE